MNSLHFLDESRAGSLARRKGFKPRSRVLTEPGRSASKMARLFPKGETSGSTKPAAQWDRTTDRVPVDRPAIERAAAQDGLNQGMAKLLIAALAEGAGSRWPF